MTTKKKTKKKSTKTVKRSGKRVRLTSKAPPKTVLAVLDPQGSLRFSATSQVAADAFVGKLKAYYRVLPYDLRPAKAVKKKEKRK